MQASDIKKLRFKLKMNQDQFGQLLGYQQPQVRVSELENGHVTISRQIVALCKLIEENHLLKQKNSVV